MNMHALILAAGQASRMGRCKALLPLALGPGGRDCTALEGLARLFRESGISRITVVTGFHAECVEAAARDLGLAVVRNPRPEDGMFSLVLLVNKADGDNAGEARVTARELSIAMKLVATDADRRVPVLTCSALHKVGLTEVWQAVLDHREYLESKYGLANYRAAQQVEWMWSQTEAAVMDTLHNTHTMRTLARELETQVRSGHRNAMDASADLLRAFAAEVPQMDWAQPKS